MESMMEKEMSEAVDNLHVLEEVAKAFGFDVEVVESARTPSNGLRYYVCMLKMDGENVIVFDDNLDSEWATYAERDLNMAAGMLLERIRSGCTLGTDNPTASPDKAVKVPPFSTMEELRMKLGIAGGKP